MRKMAGLKRRLGRQGHEWQAGIERRLRRLGGGALCLGALALLPGGALAGEATPIDFAAPQTAEESAALKERVAALHEEADRQYATAKDQCYAKFLVNACLDEAKKAYTRSNLAIRPLEQAVRDFERNQRQADADAKEAKRAADAATREQEQREQAERYRAEEARRAAEREQKIAAKAAQAEEGRRKTAAEDAERRQRDAERAKRQAERAQNKANGGATAAPAAR